MKRIESQTKGTRILTGDDAATYLSTINLLRSVVEGFGYRPIVLPNIDGAEAWSRPDHRMFGVTDSTGKPCGVLVPERTDQVRRMARAGILKPGDKVYYCERCYRHDQPQANRYREFTQFGVEWIGCEDPSSCIEHATRLMNRYAILGKFITQTKTNNDRGSAYYTGDTFEIHVPSLGASSQVVGGGRYTEGFGWAIGVERLIAAMGVES